jgi:NTP pyrophosphatase (non-canonical NTP hydrolase)
MTDNICDLPPTGWYCTREAGHEGPCAGWPIYSMAVEKYGPFAQATQAMEECGELIVAINKHFFRGKTLEDSGIIGELADVQIMVEQLIHILGVHSQVQQTKKQKLNRLYGRLTENDIFDTWNAEELP